MIGQVICGVVNGVRRRLDAPNPTNYIMRSVPTGLSWIVLRRPLPGLQTVSSGWEGKCVALGRFGTQPVH